MRRRKVRSSRRRNAHPVVPRVPNRARGNPRRYPMPGRYEGGLVIDEFVDVMTLQGAAEDEVSVEEGPYYARVALGAESLPLIEDIAQSLGETLTDEEKDFIASQAGAIVEVTDTGFVTVTYFDTERELDAAWEEIEEWTAQFYD